MERVRERRISVEDLYALKRWVATQPEAPDGPWYKDFGSFKICGDGRFPKTFLLPGQAAWGLPLCPVGRADSPRQCPSWNARPTPDRRARGAFIALGNPPHGCDRGLTLNGRDGSRAGRGVRAPTVRGRGVPTAECQGTCDQTRRIMRSPRR